MNDSVTNDPIAPLLDRLFEAQVAGCSCMTKTPDIQYHSATCHYRLHEEALQEIERLRNPDTLALLAQEISDGIRHDWGDQQYTLAERDLLALTAVLPEHPEWWEHPCMCAECRRYADG